MPQRRSACLKHFLSGNQGHYPGGGDRCFVPPSPLALPVAGSLPRDAPPAAFGAAYVAAVRTAFLEPTCVQAAFGPDDERLAAEWHAAGVSLESARRAILLGCTR